MKQFCVNCDKQVEYEISIEKREFDIRGVKIEASIKVPKCKTCGEPIFIQSIEKENEILVYDTYKRKVGLLTSTEIKEIRKKRKLSQADFAKLIKIGEKDLTRYENGAIQSKSIDLLITLVAKDDVYEKYLKPEDTKVELCSFKYDFNCLNEKYKVKGVKYDAKPRFLCYNA